MTNCLFCDQALVDIVYGIPSEATIELAKADLVALGGYKKDKSPKQYCYGCHSTF
jgi:hypothetical protein